MNDPDRYELAAGDLTASVLAHGAELCSLRNAAGVEWIWPAAPAWPRHSPILFPIVGRLTGDRLRVGADQYTMKQHGFARDRRFTWGDCDAKSCRLILQDDAQTQSAFPFAFRLEVAYDLTPDTLSVTYKVENPGNASLPFSIGAHPAFAWPLRAGKTKQEHSLRFAKNEPAPIRRLREGLLRPDPFPSPIQGRDLPLHPSLFEADAIIMDQVASQSVQYLDAGGSGLEISWHGFSELGLWSRAGGDFLCIEPWAGFSSPEGFDGEFAEKPGVITLAPGGQQAFGWQVRVSGVAQK
jgi:galactose mutarotase-like enzyme